MIEWRVVVEGSRYSGYVGQRIFTDERSARVRASFCAAMEHLTVTLEKREVGPWEKVDYDRNVA